MVDRRLHVTGRTDSEGSLPVHESRGLLPRREECQLSLIAYVMLCGNYGLAR